VEDNDSAVQLFICTQLGWLMINTDISTMVCSMHSTVAH